MASNLRFNPHPGHWRGIAIAMRRTPQAIDVWEKGEIPNLPEKLPIRYWSAQIQHL